MSVVAEKTAASPSHAVEASSFDVARLRARFPILKTKAHGHPLIYLDNGATTQKPQQVINAVARYYESENANIHRGVYQLSQTATDLYEKARRKVATFINAAEEQEIIFTRGTTEGINLVAQSWGRTFLKAGDEVIISAMEHHSNIVPWQMICEATGAKLQVIPMNDAGELLMDEYAKLLSSKTKIVSVCHLSNSLGTINDVKSITKQAHAVGAKVLVDGAQWVAHYPTDVKKLGVDFYVFSGHKLFGPTGIGVLYGRRELLDAMPPWQGGGDMIESVTFAKTTYAPLPNKFEAGTPNIAGAVGLGAAIDFIRSLDFKAIHAHEQSLLDYATAELKAVPGLRIIGTAAKKGSLISFVFEHPPIGSLEIGRGLDRAGIAIRNGHHCCQPVMDRFGIPGTARASFAMYNTHADVDALVRALKDIVIKEAGNAPRQPEVSAADVKYPVATANSPRESADELLEFFDFLPDWHARNIELDGFGSSLLPMPTGSKNEATRVHGCQSLVHLIGKHEGDRVTFLADSDSSTVRGLIGLLQRLYAGQTAQDILQFDIESFLRRVGLEEHLSMKRRSGLEGLIKKIRELATAVSSRA